MPSCSVSTCRNHNCRTKSDIKYYKFPKVEEYCTKWYLACGKQTINLKFATVCSQHFDAAASQRTKQQEVLNYYPKSYRGLKPDAVPTKNIPWNGMSMDMITPKILNAIREWCTPKVKKDQEDVSNETKKKQLVKDVLAWVPVDPGAVSVRNSLETGNPLGKSYVFNQPVNQNTMSEGSNLIQENNQIQQIPLVSVISQPETNLTHHKMLYPVNMQTRGDNLSANDKSTRPQYILVRSATQQDQVIDKKLGTHAISPIPILPDTLKNVPLKIMKYIAAYNTVDLTNSNNNKIQDPNETSGMAILKCEFKDMKQTISLLRGEIRMWQKQYTEMKHSYETLVKEHKCSLMNRKKEVDLAVHAVLSGIFTPGQIKLLLSRGTESHSRKSGIHWTHRDMKTALTLRNLSPRAYRYLRTDMNYPLPAPSSLRRFRSMVARRQEKNTIQNSSNEVQIGWKTLENEVIDSLESDHVQSSLGRNRSEFAVNDQNNRCSFAPMTDDSGSVVSCVHECCKTEINSISE